MLRKKIISMIFLIALVSSLLVGCKGGGTEKDTGTGNPITGSEKQPDKDTGKESEFSGYPINTDKSLSIWASQLGPSSTVSSWKDSPFHANLENQTGIYMDWTFPTAGSDAGQAFNLLLAETQLPDIIWHGVINDAEIYMEEGILRDLTDLLPKYAPNYWKYLQENEYADKSMKTDSGKYYGFGFFRESQWQSVYHGPMVRQDWLEEQGLDIPVTIEDWENTIRTFNKAYGAKFAFTPNWRVSPGMAGAFGAYGTIEMALYIDDNNKVQIAQAQPEWKEYMTWLNRLNKEGLIDPDVVTLDDAGLRTKIANNQVGITNANMGGLNAFLEDAEANGNGAEWVGIPYPVMNEGEKNNAIFCEDKLVSAVATLTTSCPDDKVELALRWLDYAFSEEGYYYWNFGIEGDTYTMVDGVPTYTDKIMKHELGINEGIILNTGTSGWGLGIQALQLVRQKLKPATVEAGDVWFDGTNQKAVEWIYPTAVTMTPDETTESSVIYNAISSYIKEMSLKFLTGEESLDNFDDYLQSLKNMKMDRLLEVRQAAYDRFLAR